MARTFTRFATAAACVAALSLAASPAMARPWHGRYHYYHHGVSGGDVLAGALILGGIAAVASAASNGNHDSDRDYRYETPPPQADRPEYRGSNYSGSGTYSGSGYAGGGIDNAVNSCVGEVERGRDRVAAVDNAARTADGWQISGQLGRGGNFTCAVDNDGHISNVDLGDGAAAGDQGYDGAGPDNRPVWHGADAGQAPDQLNDDSDTGGDYQDNSYSE